MATIGWWGIEMQITPDPWISCGLHAFHAIRRLNMPVIRGAIDNIYINEVVTKFGKKEATQFVIGGVKYSGGFKKWDVHKGDLVEVTYSVNAKGYNDIDKMDVVKVEGLESASKVVSRQQVPKTFPIDPLAPERAINRQNALTNAVNYVHYAAQHDVLPLAPPEEVILIAREFEAYTTGDSDAAEAYRMVRNGE